ncbi:MAG: DEAD/DEAH box helicase [Candidatus Firestonebacteria bacterium]
MTSENFSFHNLGIDIRILELLDKLGFVIPTPIQRSAIPAAVAGKDIIGVAQTGTGKTLAFGIPMIQQLSIHKGKGLILVPTRELAIQVNETLVKLTPAFGFKTAVLIGGVSIFSQIKELKKEPAILIATPGRLNDLLNRNLVKLGEFNMLILDEADRMLDMGFLPQIEIIIKRIPKERHTMLFSATIPEGIIRIAANYMKNPTHIEAAPSGTAAETVTQELFIVKRELKGKLLGEILKQYTGSVLIFTRTKRGAGKVTTLLRNLDHKAAEIHSDRSQSQRKEALDRFKAGRYRILTATDIASRGIDVTGIELVINFDVPEDPENYIHRIGRTGRAGKKGHAITLASPEQGEEVKNIEKIMRAKIPVSIHPGVPSLKFGSGHRTPSKVTQGSSPKSPASTSLPAAGITKRVSKNRYNTKSWKNYESRPFLGKPVHTVKFDKAPKPAHKEHLRAERPLHESKTTEQISKPIIHTSAAIPVLEFKTTPNKVTSKKHSFKRETFSFGRPDFQHKHFDKNGSKRPSGNRFERNEGWKKPERFGKSPAFYRDHPPRRDDGNFHGNPSNVTPVKRDENFGNKYEHNEGRVKTNNFEEKRSFHERKTFHERATGYKNDSRNKNENNFDRKNSWKKPQTLGKKVL